MALQRKLCGFGTFVVRNEAQWLSHSANVCEGKCGNIKQNMSCPRCSHTTHLQSNFRRQRMEKNLRKQSTRMAVLLKISSMDLFVFQLGNGKTAVFTKATQSFNELELHL